MLNPHLEFKNDLNVLKEKNLLRALRDLQSPQGPHITLDGRKVLNFSSNDYLGLASCARLKEAVKKTVTEYGVGSASSRLICGNSILYRKCEEKLASLKGAERALIFSSGYAANVGTISALVSKGDAVFCDRLNHASIMDGIILSRAKLFRYQHADVGHLGSLLSRKNSFRRKLIITDTVFSMDGDLAPLEDLADIAEEHGALLMADEAHAFGIFGKHGAGLAGQLNLDKKISVSMGTFSKAAGVVGGYITSRADIADYLINHSRSLIYSTALPPPVLGGILEALDMIREGADLRKKLWENIAFLKAGLVQIGFPLCAKSESAIFSILVGDDAKTMALSRKLFEKGVFIQGIRPPSVPCGTSRLRLTVSASHTQNDLSLCLETLKSAAQETGIF